jgi:hypothetical protein
LLHQHVHENNGNCVLLDRLGDFGNVHAVGWRRVRPFVSAQPYHERLVRDLAALAR